MTNAQMLILFVLAFALPLLVGWHYHKSECERKEQELTRVRDAYYRGYADAKREMQEKRR